MYERVVHIGDRALQRCQALGDAAATAPPLRKLACSSSGCNTGELAVKLGSQ